MAATETGTFNNFIDGESVAAAEGRTTDVLNPADGKAFAQAPDSTGRGRRPRRQGRARRAFDGWSNTTPGERSLALLKLADALEEHGDEIAELEARNAGKPLQAVKDDEIGAMVDNLRFFAGAARNLEGKAAGEYLEGYTSLDAPRGGRRDRPDRALELPADDGDLEDRPGARRGQHDRPQARPDDAADDAAPRRDRGRVPAQGRAQRRRRRQRDRRRARHPRRRRHDLADRLRRDRQVDRAQPPRTRSSACTSSSAARRRSWSSTTPTWRPMAETIAGTGWYNAGQDCTAATRVLAGSKVYDDVAAGPRRPVHRATRPATRSTRRPTSGRSTPPSSASASRASSSARPTHARDRDRR